MLEADCSGSFGCKSPKEAPRGRTLFCASPILPGFARRGAGCSGLGACVPPGRGKRGSRFRVPPGGAKGLSPLQWQGPSPLPQRHADLRPSVLRVAPVLCGASRAGGETRVAFPYPARPKTLFPQVSFFSHLVERVLSRRYLFRRRAECIITEPVRGIAVAPDMPGGLEPAPDLGTILDSARNGVTV